MNGVEILISAPCGAGTRACRAGTHPGACGLSEKCRCCLHYTVMLNSRRRLPHVYPEGKWLFPTWHLHGSLPQTRYPPPGKLSAGEAFVWMDRYLDTTRK